jgi:Uma2 family endonuclease
MENVITRLPLLTVDELREFEQRPENRDRKFELIEGIIYEKMTASFLSSSVGLRLGQLLLNYLDENPIGRASGSDGGYILSDGNRYLPDIGYISKERLPESIDEEIPMAPDFAVEVKSPSNSRPELQQKALKYLQYGTRLVWIVYPNEQVVEVFKATAGPPEILAIKVGGTLDGGEVLPGFRVDVAEVFAG